MPVRPDQDGLILLHNASGLIVRKDGTKLYTTNAGVTGGFTSLTGVAMNSSSTSTGGTGSSAYTFGDVVAACKEAGLLGS